ncbi:LVIVD repeat-containing protein [uncultured Pseudokineococcus sp.]|uniref:LVIVD repeat-containing protein n=1 Tax=uncultured Pseudokineococcus sp. TaxID=1642928 RepID=UPI00262693AD|nr:hypothetical protein [uncultured Pseudokineococcus sp.]
MAARRMSTGRRRGAGRATGLTAGRAAGSVAGRAVVAGAAAAALVAGSAATALAAPDQAPAAPSVPAGEAPTGVGETASSANLRLTANVPKQGSFASASALNSDLAFQGQYAYAGNYNGFAVYDLSRPDAPELVTQVTCLGSQNDVSVYGDVLVLSTDSVRSDASCESTSVPAASADVWEGLKIFDISDPLAPEYVAAVKTTCGSHTNTLVPDEESGSLLVYVSSYGPSAAAPNCQPPHDAISIVDIPLDAMEDAAVVDVPVIFPDGGFAGVEGTVRRPTSGCHDITSFVELGIAAGACMGDGVIFDISDPRAPVVTERVQDENFAFWHSATFNNDGTKVVFTDELGGGGAPTCTAEIGPERGANAIYDLVDGELEFASYYKIPRHQTPTENCVAHNGSLLPVEGRDVMVQAWYQGGISVFDFTDSSEPREVAWFDRGPLSTETPVIGGSWSAYFYDGRIYSNDIQQGFDVLRLRGSAFSQARLVELGQLNPQMQGAYTSWRDSRRG